jgi:hypothetical protein
MVAPEERGVLLLMVLVDLGLYLYR